MDKLKRGYGNRKIEIGTNEEGKRNYNDGCKCITSNATRIYLPTPKGNSLKKKNEGISLTYNALVLYN